MTTHNSVQINFDDYGTVSTNKMDISELNVNDNETLFDNKCREPEPPVTHFTRQITTWQGADDNDLIRIQDDYAYADVDDNDFEFDLDNHNQNWITPKLHSNDDKMVISELEDDKMVISELEDDKMGISELEDDKMEISELEDDKICK
jgi:hypothetical protein